MTKTTPTFYLFHGDDSLSVDEAVGKMRAQMLEEDPAAMNISEFDGQTAAPAEVVAAASSFPFLASKRLVIVRGMLAWITRKGAGEVGKKAVETLLNELPALPPTARLVFVEHEELSKTHKILKLAQEHPNGYEKAFTAPKDSTNWILKRARDEYQAKLQPQAAAALASVTGDDLRRADNELLKLVAYVDGEREITEADVALLTPYVPEASMFALVDAMAEGRADTAAATLHSLLDAGETPFSLYGMIVRQFRLLLLAREHLDAGGAVGELAGVLKSHPYVAQKIAVQSRRFSLLMLKQIYETLLEYDIKMKTGRIAPELALDVLIAGLAK